MSKWLFFIAVPVLIFLAFNFFYINNDKTTTAALVNEKELERIVRMGAYRQELLADETQQILMILSKLPVVKDRDASKCNMMFGMLLANQKRYMNFGVINPDGSLFCSGVPAKTPLNLSERAYFSRAMERGNFAVGDYQVGKVTGKPSLNFGYPFKDANGKILGVIFTSIDLSWLKEFSNVVELPRGAQLIVTDQDGTVLARFPEGSAGIAAPEISATPKRIINVQEDIGVIEMKDNSGQTYTLVIAPIKLAEQEGFLHLILSIPSKYVASSGNTAGQGLADFLRSFLKK